MISIPFIWAWQFENQLASPCWKIHPFMPSICTLHVETAWRHLEWSVQFIIRFLQFHDSFIATWWWSQWYSSGVVINNNRQKPETATQWIITNNRLRITSCFGPTIIIRTVSRNNHNHENDTTIKSCHSDNHPHQGHHCQHNIYMAVKRTPLSPRAIPAPPIPAPGRRSWCWWWQARWWHRGPDSFSHRQKRHEEAVESVRL